MNSGVTILRPSTRVTSLPPTYSSVTGKQPPRGLDHGVVLDVRVLVAVPEQLHRRVDQQQPEDQEHEREQRQQRGAERDEDRAHDQREHDAEGQHLVLVLLGHRERRHDDHEDEQVVDREALLDDVAGEVLGAELAAVRPPHPGTERERRRRCRTPTTRWPPGSPPRCGRSAASARSSASSATITPIVTAQVEPADLQHSGDLPRRTAASTGPDTRRLRAGYVKST